MGGIRIQDLGYTSGISVDEIKSSWIQEEAVIGRRYGAFGGGDASLKCPEYCTYALPNSVGILDMAKEIGKRVAKIDESLRQSRLKDIDSLTVRNDMMAAGIIHASFAISILYLTRRPKQVARGLESVRSFTNSVLGYDKRLEYTIFVTQNQFDLI